MEPFLGKKYQLESNDKFDEYMKELGVGFITRKAGNAASNTVILTKDRDVYTFKVDSTFKNQTLSFKLGEEFDEETMDGRKVKTTFEASGNILTQFQKGSPKDTTIVREFTDTACKAVYTAGSVVCTRIFKAI